MSLRISGQENTIWFGLDRLVSKITVDSTAQMVEHIASTIKIKHRNRFAAIETNTVARRGRTSPKSTSGSVLVRTSTNSGLSVASGATRKVHLPIEASPGGQKTRAGNRCSPRRLQAHGKDKMVELVGTAEATAGMTH